MQKNATAKSTRTSTSNSPSKKGKGQETLCKKAWKDAEDPNRPDRDLILKNFPGADKIPLTGSISAQVNQLYRFALEQNPYRLLWIATNSRVFLPYYANHHNAYSGPDISFTERGIAAGGSAKVDQLVNMTEVLLDEYVMAKDGSKKPNNLWLGGFDAAQGGLVSWLVTKARTAKQRVLKQEYDKAERKILYFDRNLIAAQGVSMDDENASDLLPEGQFATKAELLAEEVAEEEQKRIKLRDKTHRRNVGFFRRSVALFEGWSATSRRAWRPYFVALLAFHGIEPNVVNFPPAKAKQNQKRRATDRQWNDNLNMLVALLKAELERTSHGFDHFPTLLVSA